MRLKDLGNWYGGGTPSKSNPEFWTDGDVPWLSPKDMGPETLDATIDRVTPAAVAGSSTKLVPAGSVAVVTRSGILERTIPVALVPFATTMNQDMKAVVPRDGIDARWIAWGLRAYERELLRDSRKAGTTVASLEMPRFYDFELPIPPIDEQSRIVAILEDHLSRLDAADRALDDAPRRTVVLQESWLARRLTSAAAEVTTIGATLRDVRGGWSRSRDDLVSSAEGVPYLKMNNITRRGALDLNDLVFVAASDDLRAKYGVEPGDVLFNSKNSGDLIGKTTLADARIAGAVINENIMRLRFDDRVEPAFAALWFMGPTMRGRILAAASASTNVAAVYQKDLVRFPMWIPDKVRQRQLVAEFDQIRQDGEVLDAATSRAVARSRGLRRSLLAAAFSGSLTGSATDDSSHVEEMIGA